MIVCIPAYEWVHLGHVAAQPEQPAARGRQKQAQLENIRHKTIMFQVVVKSFCRCLNEPIQYASKAQLHNLHICTLVVRKIYTFCSFNNFFGKFYLNPKIGKTKEVEKSLKSNCLTRTNKKTSHTT